MTTLTIAEIDTIIESLDAYERPRGENIHFCENEENTIKEAMGPELGGRIVDGLMQKIKGMKDSDRSRKELCTILKAKLYSMKNDIRLEQSLNSIPNAGAKQ